MKHHLPKIIVAIVIIAACAGVWEFFGLWQLFEPVQTVEQEALAVTNDLLEILKQTPSPASLEYQCNRFLHNKLASGLGYTVEVKSAFSVRDPDHEPHGDAPALGGRTAIVLVTFADESAAKLNLLDGKYLSCTTVETRNN